MRWIGLWIVAVSATAAMGQTTQPAAQADGQASVQNSAQNSSAATTQPAIAQPPSPEQVLNQMLRPVDADKSSALTPQSAAPTGAAAADEGTSAVATSSTGGSTAALTAQGSAGVLQPIAPEGGINGILREGTAIIDRVGRLQKAADGPWSELVFDSDGRVMRDPPMIILPNLKLTMMESEISKVSDDLRFRVTGTVTEYHNRNYILLDKVVVVNNKNQEF